MNFETINLLYRYNKKLSHEKIKNMDLSESQWLICSYIYYHNGCSQDDVANSLDLDKTTIAKSLAVLENKKIINRTQDKDDKRIKRLSISEKENTKITKLINDHNNWLKKIISCLSKEEQKEFELYCDRIIKNAEKLVEEK